MKKKLIFILISVFFIVLLIENYFIVSVDKSDTAMARYIYGDKNIVTEISNADMQDIIETLDGKVISIFDLPSCGFDENIAVVIGNKTFSIACDECGVIYYKDHNGYISLDDYENEKLRTLLECYGFSWPCV